MIRYFFLILFSIMFARELDVEFISENSWLAGHPWASGVAFDNSITYGLGVYGVSSVNINDAIDI